MTNPLILEKVHEHAWRGEQKARDKARRTGAGVVVVKDGGIVEGRIEQERAVTPFSSFAVLCFRVQERGVRG
jgi:hypothetical protein